ncbi:MAG: DHH family phosphoesterase [Pseudomonadota bacterium]
MADFDLFNGDADGIFSLLQLRQVDPRPDATLITGVKRDIRLFPRIAGHVSEGDRITALDISMAKNTDGLRQALAAGAEVFYADHHQTGEIPEHPNLQVITDMSKETCTAYLIDRHLHGAKAAWAVCGAYGDNFQRLAQSIAERRSLSLPLGRLRELGELVNYNAYGLTLDDLHFDPADLYTTLLAYPDPMAFLDDDHPAFATLQSGYASDWDVAQKARELDISDAGHVLSLPAGPASNRISGLFGNALVDEDPQQAFAVLTEIAGDPAAYRVSVRAPRGRDSGSAAALATQFGGGGRAAAAGIDMLPESELGLFIDAFRTAFQA